MEISKLYNENLLAVFRALFAADAVVITVKMRTVTWRTCIHGCITGSPGCAAVGVRARAILLCPNEVLYLGRLDRRSWGFRRLRFRRGFRACLHQLRDRGNHLGCDFCCCRR